MRTAWFFPVIVCVLVWDDAAFAQRRPAGPPTPSDTLTGEAKEAFEEARTLFRKGDFTGSLDALERTQKLSPDPRIFWNMAACEKKLGHYARAVGDVDRYLTSGASILTDDEKREAAQFIAAAKAFVGTVNVISNVDGTQVRVDETLLGTTPLAKPIVVDEGEHRVRFVRSGYKTVERTEQAPAGSDLRWAVELAPESEAAASTSTATPPLSSPSIHAKAPSRLGPLLLGGAGIAVAGAGAIFVGLTLREASKIETECGTTCPPSRWEKYRTMQTAGDVLLGVGGAALLGSAIWWILQPTGPHEERRAWIAPTIGGVSAGASF